MSSCCVKGLAYFYFSPTLTAVMEFLFQFSFVVKCKLWREIYMALSRQPTCTFWGGGSLLEVDIRIFGRCASHIFGSVLKTWVACLLWKFGIHIGWGCHSSDDHILKTVGSERTSTNLRFVSSRHSHTYQLYISWYSTRMWHDVHVFGGLKLAFCFSALWYILYLIFGPKGLNVQRERARAGIACHLCKPQFCIMSLHLIGKNSMNLPG